jgi:hypothetical protein
VKLAHAGRYPHPAEILAVQPDRRSRFLRACYKRRRSRCRWKKKTLKHSTPVSQPPQTASRPPGFLLAFLHGCMATNRLPAARSYPCISAWASWPSYAQVPPLVSLFFFFNFLLPSRCSTRPPGSITLVSFSDSLSEQPLEHRATGRTCPSTAVPARCMLLSLSFFFLSFTVY